VGEQLAIKVEVVNSNPSMLRLIQRAVLRVETCAIGYDIRWLLSEPNELGLRIWRNQTSAVAVLVVRAVDGGVPWRACQRRRK
jgi:hypothetical protein